VHQPLPTIRFNITVNVCEKIIFLLPIWSSDGLFTAKTFLAKHIVIIWWVYVFMRSIILQICNWTKIIIHSLRCCPVNWSVGLSLLLYSSFFKCTTKVTFLWLEFAILLIYLPSCLSQERSDVFDLRIMLLPS